jgi:hypothetical protein
MALERLMGMLLVMIAVQMFLNGLKFSSPAEGSRPLVRRVLSFASSSAACRLRSMNAGSLRCVRVSAVRSSWSTGPSARRSLPMVLVLLWMTACSTARPVLYPNAHLQSVGRAVADRDIKECEQKAETAGVDRQKGGVGDVAAGTGVGAGVGAAGGAVGGASREGRGSARPSAPPAGRSSGS